MNAHHHLLQTAFRTLPGTRGVPMSSWLPTMAAAYAEVGVDGELSHVAARRHPRDERPPLRDRPEDIPTLARFFIDRFCRDLGKRPLVLSPSAEQDLRTYAWPGNVRELQNCIERAAILTEGDTIQPRHLNLSFRGPLAAPPEEDGGPWSKIDLSGTLGEATRRTVAEVERRKIEQALKDAGGNRGRAAEVLQVSFKAFTSKLRDYGFE